mmetsp:Transcript_41148/g.92402  ORF Transcript_41148/g.92402 Transcript_41148/m.92402 type:complete len:310 (-) Transcript_41148:28-957(-)
MQHVTKVSQNALLAGASALLVGGVAYRYGVGSQPSPGPKVMKVMSYNVLARPYTTYNTMHHRAPSRIEDKVQTITRYTLAGETILSSGSDVVLLQECEGAFFKSDWNAAAERLAQQYTVFLCGEGEKPGTAILVKKTGEVTPLAEKALWIGGTDATGGVSKSAAILPVQFGHKTVDMVSVHFTWDGLHQKRTHHAQLLGGSLQSSSIVLAGDFNCEPGKMLNDLEQASFLKSMQRAALLNNAPTGLSSDFSKEVALDHLYTSADLQVITAFAQGRPDSPWGGSLSRPAKVARASDHVPVVATVTEKITE